MKKPVQIDPNAAFPDEKKRPTDADLPAALGRASDLLRQLLERVRTAHPDLAADWKFSPRSGWHQIYSRKQRRILYFIPKRGDFRLSLILGDKAVASLQAGPHAKSVAVLMQAATRYPEGTAFSFNHRTLDVALTAALIEAKLAF